MFNRSISGIRSNVGRSEIGHDGESEATQAASTAQKRDQHDQSEVIRMKKFDLEAEIAEIETELNTDEESEKEEVNSNEI